MKYLLTVLILLAGAATIPASEPPDVINYQGVLRDSSDAPLEGNHDMVFRFYNAEFGGDEILVDTHDAVHANPVTVTGGLFGVHLGGGMLADGAGPGSYTSLADVFRDYSAVWLAVEIGGEPLMPRTQVIAAAYALNADHLDGADSAQLLRSDTSDSFTAGTLTVVNGTTLEVEGILRMEGPVVKTGTEVVSNLNADFLDGLDSVAFAPTAHGHAGGDITTPVQQAVNSDTVDGRHSSYFINTSPTSQTKPGDLTLSDLYLTGDDIHFQSGSTLTGDTTMLEIIAGDSNADRLILAAGDGDDGHIEIKGGQAMLFKAGNGDYTFYDSAGSATVVVTPHGHLSVPDTVLASVLNVNTFGTLLPYNTFGHGTPLSSMDDSSDVYIESDLEVGKSLIVDGPEILLNYGGTSSLASLRFYDEGSVDSNELLWTDVWDRFLMTAGLAIDGPIQTGSPAPTPVAYNRLGPFQPSSGLLTSTSDLLVGDDLEVGGELALSGTVYMEGNSSGTDGDQSLYFFDDGSRTREYLRWDDSESRFDLSDDLRITNGLVVDGGNITFETSSDTERYVRHAHDIVMSKDTDNDGSSWFRWYDDNQTIEQMRIRHGDEAATAFDGAVNANGLDYAEAFKVLDPTVEAGDVVSLLLDAPGYVRRTDGAYAAHVAGVISEKPGFVTGNSFDAEEQADAEIAALRQQASARGDYEAEKELTVQLIAKKEELLRPVALVGRVEVKVDGAHGAIVPGDHLTSSPTPGHAMTLDRPGPSLGIALEGWSDPGQGKILALVRPGYFDPSAGPAAGEPDVVAGGEDSVPAPTSETQAVAGNLQVVLDRDANDQSRFSIFRDGEEQLGAEVFRVDEHGNVYARGSFRPAAMDIAEYHPVNEPVAIGDVLVADRERPGSLSLGRDAADPAVVGIVSGEPGVLLGSGMSHIAAVDLELAAQLDEARAFGDRGEEARLWNELEARFSRTHAAIGLSGTLPCKVDAGYGEIQVGDLLTTSPTPGHAMRSDDLQPGTILGKALEPHATGTGVIRVLVMLR